MEIILYKNILKKHKNFIILIIFWLPFSKKKMRKIYLAPQMSNTQTVQCFFQISYSFYDLKKIANNLKEFSLINQSDLCNGIKNIKKLVKGSFNSFKLI